MTDIQSRRLFVSFSFSGDELKNNPVRQARQSGSNLVHRPEIRDDQLNNDGNLGNKETNTTKFSFIYPHFIYLTP